MRVLIVHHEAQYFAGAEKVLGYFLAGLAGTGCEVAVAAVRDCRVPELIPPGMPICWLPRNDQFSIGALASQVRVLWRYHRQSRFDLVHAWAARDWELAAVLGRLAGRPVVGTLHDHPRASFISPARQRLMAWSAATGLRRIVCVSEAVRQACAAVGYAGRKLTVVRNGLPAGSAPRRTVTPGRFRLGYLGLFSERKGLRGLFEILDQLAVQARPWEMALAGNAQEEEGQRLLEEIKDRYAARSWWKDVHWLGWVKRPSDFLASIDLLVCPSSEFDPFPTVLLEAGQMGVPVLAGRVGGVSEIIEDGRTGWLFERAAWSEASARLREILANPERAREAGVEARKRVEREFTVERMVADYLTVYQALLP